MLCTSGFVDDVMFSHNNPGSFRVLLCGKHYNQITTQIPTKYYSTIKTGSTHCELRTRAKSAAYDCLVNSQGRRQVKICGVDRHGSRGARAYNGGLEAERPPFSAPCKNTSDLYQFQERLLAKVGWTCPPLQSTPWRRHC